MDGDTLVASLRAENEALKRQLALQASESQDATYEQTGLGWQGCGLTGSQVSRYSRQLVLPSFGPQAQARLCQGSVLIVGAGGLGSSAALYLAAAGVGHLGIVDTDALELSNLHRQIAHQEASVGKHKAASAAASCRALNSSIQVTAHEHGLLPHNALELVGAYDVVLDCSDNAPTRYLASDACCLAGKPLVSGAALGMDGQLTTLCVQPDGPCYRCLYPEAPAQASCRRCSEAGVLGVAPGIIGTLQALEAIKLLTGVGQPLTSRLLLLDCLSTRFRCIKLRHRQPQCITCGDQPSITQETLADYDFHAFTGQPFNDTAPPNISLLPADQRLNVQDLASKLQQGSARLSAPSPQKQHPPSLSPTPLHAETSANSAAGSDHQSPNPVDAEAPANSFAATNHQIDPPGYHEAGTSSVSHAHPSSEQPCQGSQPSSGMRPSAGPLLLDVRPKEQFDAAHLPGFVNVPYQGPHKPLSNSLLELCRSHQSGRSQAGDASSAIAIPSSGGPEAGAQAPQSSHSSSMGEPKLEAADQILVVCRRGNDSQEVVQQLHSLGITGAMDIVGGLTAWSQTVDPSFPIY